MNVALLTTDTPHHLYYAWQLGERLGLRAIFLETRAPVPAFETRHAFEKDRDEYERAVLLAGGPASFDAVAPTRHFPSLNDGPAVSALTALAPDVTLVFGTGKLRQPTIAAARAATLNLHGGDPELYRGLDSHLWAIYHADFAALVTTLHHVARELDTGDIVMQTALPLTRGMGLHELRAVNTRACVSLSLAALAALGSTGALPGRPQRGRGRYYSLMPAVLKDVCITRFDRHVGAL